MNNLIERYVYDVVRRLPEKERDEVRRELEANIYDMLENPADDDEVKAVLQGLGAPALLAEKYRQGPRYLISPAVYDNYTRMLKWMLPLVGGILLAVGVVFGGVEALQQAPGSISAVLSAMISRGISLGVSGAVQALVWTTVGFVIADRAGYKAALQQEGWKPEDLPEILQEKRYTLPLADSVAELVVSVVFLVLALLYCSGQISLPFVLSSSGVRVLHLFSAEFMQSCVPVIGIMLVLTLIKGVAKITARRWTPVVCAAVILDNVLSVAAMLYLFSRPSILSGEFLAFVNTVDWGTFDLMRFMGQPVANPLLLVIGTIVVVCAVAESISAIYKTVKNSAGAGLEA